MNTAKSGDKKNTVSSSKPRRKVTHTPGTPLSEYDTPYKVPLSNTFGTYIPEGLRPRRLEF